MDEKQESKLKLISSKTVSINSELYIIVDFLNKSLKEHHLMFGLTKDSANETMTVSVYEV